MMKQEQMTKKDRTITLIFMALFGLITFILTRNIGLSFLGVGGGMILGYAFTSFFKLEKKKQFSLIVSFILFSLLIFLIKTDLFYAISFGIGFAIAVYILIDLLEKNRKGILIALIISLVPTIMTWFISKNLTYLLIAWLVGWLGGYGIASIPKLDAMGKRLALTAVAIALLINLVRHGAYDLLLILIILSFVIWFIFSKVKRLKNSKKRSNKK